MIDIEIIFLKKVIGYKHIRPSIFIDIANAVVIKIFIAVIT